MSFLLYATDYLEVQQKFSMEELWRLFDGDRENMNLAHECVDRHRGKGRAITVKHDNGRLEYVDFDQLIRDSSQFAYFLEPFSKISLRLLPNIINERTNKIIHTPGTNDKYNLSIMIKP